MSLPLRQNLKVGAYLMSRRLRSDRHFTLVLDL